MEINTRQTTKLALNDSNFIYSKKIKKIFMRHWLVLFFLFTNNFFNSTIHEPPSNIIKGVSIVSPQQYISEDYFSPIKKINAEWVAVTPFGFLDASDTKIQYPTSENYWGDYPENLKSVIQQAKSHQLKVLLKPHIWVNGHGWAGDYDLYFWEWKHWELSYKDFILSFAELAESLDVEMFCIGVEWKTAIRRRPGFWRSIIQEIRKIYSGKLIYAANWDEFEYVPFWKDLDYVGIDGYFPLSNSKTPTKEELNQAWKPVVKKISKFYKKTKRPIIFTEYGYRSTDFACWNQWEIENLKDHEFVNMQAQQNGYEAFYESVSHQEWYAGGFIWKWHPEKNTGGIHHSNYTPQGKPVLETIKKWYE